MSLYTAYDTTEEAEAAAIAYAEENGSIPFDGMNCNDYKEDDDIECEDGMEHPADANVAIVESLGTSRRILMASFTP